ncbi:MAG: MltA domain-containing protein [Saprospiraceae bacterium]
MKEKEPEGINTQRKMSAKVLELTDPDTLPYLPFDPPMLQALYEQVTYLHRPEVKHGASGINRKEMLKTVQLLEGIQLLNPEVLRQTFDFYKIKTSLKSDRIRVTGYYTPLIKASRVHTDQYPVPMLRRPASGIPSPAAIEAGALAGRDLELAWLRSRKELSNAQLQGNCLIEFPDGKREHFGFGGSVKGAGGTYIFFVEVDEKVLGAGFFPLTAGYSVAVDPRFIPIGSTLLAELPDLDVAGHLKGYKYRIIFAQDRGGAILTTKRIDLYCGVGQKGLQEARKINRYGRLWLLLPKQH